MQTKPVNTANVRTAINIMRGATNLCMLQHQAVTTNAYDSSDPIICTTTEELHKCGNTACFAGYVGVSDEWRALGGWIDSHGQPLIHDGLGRTLVSVDAIHYWIGGDWDFMDCMIMGGVFYRDGDVSYCGFYGKDFADVTKEDVIAALETLL